MIKEFTSVASLIFIVLLNMVRSPYDDYGCCISCGYQWCETLNKCVRVWETYCQSLENGH
jgi:hypothetical protein